MDSEMDALDLESQLAKMLQVLTQPLEAHESENHDSERRETAAPEVPVPIAWREPEAEAQRSIEAGMLVDEARNAAAHAADESTLERQLNQFSSDEDETQLAAIRELMVRALDRGVWLTLGEIAEVTDFAEASISAQLRHLRKAYHGGHRVEKRRRRRSREGAVSTVRDGRRGPVIWEYRVLPPGAGSGVGSPGWGRKQSPVTGVRNPDRTGSERRAAEEADA